MSFKDALNKSAEAQKKLEEDTKKLTEKTSTPKKNSVGRMNESRSVNHVFSITRPYLTSY